MSKYFKIFGITNLAWAAFLILFSIFYRHQNILLIAPLFLVSGIGLLFKLKFSWTLNFILGSLVTFGMAAAITSSFFRTTDVGTKWDAEQFIVVVTALTLTLLTGYSLVRTLKKDFQLQMEIGPVQRNATLALAAVLTIVFIVGDLL